MISRKSQDTLAYLRYTHGLPSQDISASESIHLLHPSLSWVTSLLNSAYWFEGFTFRSINKPPGMVLPLLALPNKAASNWQHRNNHPKSWSGAMARMSILGGSVNLVISSSNSCTFLQPNPQSLELQTPLLSVCSNQMYYSLSS